MQYQLFSVMKDPSRPKIVIKKMMKKDSMMQEFELRKNQLECSAEQLKFSPTAARHRAVVARIPGMVGMVIRGKPDGNNYWQGGTYRNF